MGTRAIIQVQGSGVCVFQHWDGYPSHTLPILRKVTEEFRKERGHEPDMFLAFLVQHLRNLHELSLDTKGNNPTGFRLFTKTEAKQLGGIEYSYLIQESGDIQVKTGLVLGVRSRRTSK